jgi:hypothetical protein
VGEDQPYSVLFQNIKNWVDQIGFVTELHVVPGFLRNFAEESIQILGQFRWREAIVLDMVFLFEEEAVQVGAKDLEIGNSLTCLLVF